MQDLIKALLGDLHVLYFKPNGFRKQRGRFLRQVDTVVQVIEFQSSAWNSVGQAITFYVNVCCGFTDVSTPDSATVLSGRGRLGGLAQGAPESFALKAENYADIRAQLLGYLPSAVDALASYYEVVKKRASQGYSTPIPLPDSWRV